MSMEALNLKDYFTLTDDQMITIIHRFDDFITALTDIILNHYCSALPDKQSCIGRNLAILQMTSSYITRVPPPPV